MKMLILVDFQPPPSPCQVGVFYSNEHMMVDGALGYGAFGGLFVVVIIFRRDKGTIGIEYWWVNNGIRGIIQLKPTDGSQRKQLRLHVTRSKISDIVTTIGLYRK